MQEKSNTCEFQIHSLIMELVSFDIEKDQPLCDSASSSVSFFWNKQGQRCTLACIWNYEWFEWVIDWVRDSLIDPEPWFVVLSRREQRFLVNSALFHRFNESMADQPTDQPMNTTSYRVAWAHLKMIRLFASVSVCVCERYTNNL